MSHFTSGTSENRDVGFSTDSALMINVEHCRRDVTLI